ncbi:MAG: DNA/RNA non-specific endonuclease [Andreesenia angusta]|nr:DNA/RNA non-specific endonuclease [Andreesenia angusta]
MGAKSKSEDDFSDTFSDDITRENTDDWGKEKNRKRESGYDEEFLGNDYIVELPKLSNSMVEDAARTKEGNYVLDYMHFSIAMSRSRGLAFYTAVNIDGNQLKRVKRSDKWEYDNRIDREYQYGQELYSRNDLDRGHLVRRNDPNWGSLEDAKKANDDTFHFTNCSPQHKNLNQKTWLNLEDYILNNTRTHGLKVSVFTGPVFRTDDMVYRDKYKIPAEFWKVAVMVKNDGKLSATAYLQTQKNMIDNLEFAFGEYETYQVPIELIENITGLDFNDLRKYDPVANLEVSGLLISDEKDIRL